MNKRSKFDLPQSVIDKRWSRTDKECKECFTIFSATPKAIYCSPKCSYKHNKRISRTTGKIASRGNSVVDRVDHIDVFIKYDWMCAKCNIHTPRELIGTYEDNAPSLDHIIPISKGGDHSYRNTQLLCRKCNQEKGAKI